MLGDLSHWSQNQASRKHLSLAMRRAALIFRWLERTLDSCALTLPLQGFAVKRRSAIQWSGRLRRRSLSSSTSGCEGSPPNRPPNEIAGCIERSFWACQRLAWLKPVGLTECGGKPYKMAESKYKDVLSMKSHRCRSAMTRSNPPPNQPMERTPPCCALRRRSSAR